MKKTIVFIFAVLFSVVSMAQYGYRVEIKQVFPAKSTIYSNAFNFKREMDNAISGQTAKLNGNSNYQILITTPSGKETRNIQNIHWIQIVNGINTNHAGKTYPLKSYNEPTIWEGYACSVDGSRIKGKTEKKEFVYRVSMADKPDDFKTAFVDEETAEAEAQKLFEENTSDDRLVEVIIFKYEGGNVKEVERKTNKEKYETSLQLIAEKQARLEKRKQEDALVQHVEQFRKDMLSVKKNDNRVIFCREALENVLKLPNDLYSLQELDSMFWSRKLDSLFMSKRLDSLYRSVFEKDVLSSLKSGQKKKINKPLDYIMNPVLVSGSANPREFLLQCTREIEETLYPPKNDKAKKGNKKSNKK